MDYINCEVDDFIKFLNEADVENFILDDIKKMKTDKLINHISNLHNIIFDYIFTYGIKKSFIIQFKEEIHRYELNYNLHVNNNTTVNSNNKKDIKLQELNNHILNLHNLINIEIGKNNDNLLILDLKCEINNFNYLNNLKYNEYNKYINQLVNNINKSKNHIYNLSMIILNKIKQNGLNTPFLSSLNKELKNYNLLDDNYLEITNYKLQKLNNHILNLHKIILKQSNNSSNFVMTLKREIDDFESEH